jgi:hypothetical protein
VSIRRNIFLKNKIAPAMPERFLSQTLWLAQNL